MAATSTDERAVAATAHLVRRLARVDAFAHSSAEIRIVETHISWVVLTGDFVYKIKKPVNLGFLDFSTLDRRRHFCLEELRLNRRFAPQLYLDVVPIGGTPETPCIGGAPVLEWAVRMRQFADAARLDDQLATGTLTVTDMRSLGEYLAGMHRTAPLAGAGEAFGSPLAIRQPAIENFDALGTLLAHRSDAAARLARVETLRAWTEAEFARIVELLGRRREIGMIRECHGDLHLANLVRLDAGIVAFDCLEFDPALRWIDVVNDYAFTLMDLLRRGRADLGFAFLNAYLETFGDYAGITLLPFYIGYRALVRAKIAAIEARQQGTDPVSIDAYLDLAMRLASPRIPLLVVMHGLSGSGKSHVSAELAERLPAIRLRSDVLRKRLAGLDPRAASGSPPEAGIYTEDATRALYSHLREFAATGLRGGFDVIVDATCLAAWQRRLFLELAATGGYRVVLLHCFADQETLERRVARRLADHADASEANLEILRSQIAKQEPLAAEEESAAIPIDTGRSIDFTSLLAVIRNS